MAGHVKWKFSTKLSMVSLQFPSAVDSNALALNIIE